MSSLNLARKLTKAALYGMRVNAGLDAAEATKTYKSFLSRVEKTIVSQVNRTLDNEKLIDDLISLYNKAEADPNLLGFLAKAWTSFEAVFNDLFGKDTLIEFYIWAGTQGGQNAIERMGIEISFQLRNDAVTEYLADRKNLLVRSVDATSMDQLVRLLQEGREKQWTAYQIKQEIRSRFADITPARAEAIAETELAHAFNAVEYETYRRNGAQKMRWITVLDERVCEICQPLHNTEVAISDLFGGEFEYPPAHPRCRCFTEEVIEGVSVRGNALVWAGE